MTLKTQMLRGLFALPLLALMAFAQASLAGEGDGHAATSAVAAPGAHAIDLLADCTAYRPAADLVLVSTPADLPARLRLRQFECRRA